MQRKSRRRTNKDANPKNARSRARIMKTRLNGKKVKITRMGRKDELL